VEFGPLGPAVVTVRSELRRQIDEGELAPGARLGAEREIAERLGVSRSTVRAALADLERSGAKGRSSVTSPASAACRPTCAGRASSQMRG
jgi:DNA-binding transcriptional MocR family regulator